MADREHHEGWFYEGTVPGSRHGNIEHGFKMQDLIYKGRTDFQEVLIFDNPVYGRVLVLDGIVQLSTADEFVYHEMLVQPAMLSHPDPKRVLIIGGGDGGTLREVLRHHPDQVVMIDLDKTIAELSQQHLPGLSDGGFYHPSLELVHEDASVCVRRYSDHFDVAIIDCNDAVGPSMPLFEAPFYEDVARALTPSGLCAVQAGSFLDIDFLKTLYARARTHLGDTTAFRFTMPSYHCGEYCVLVAGQDSRGPGRDTIEERMRARGLEGNLRYYNPSLHDTSRTLPDSMVLG
jgi:spermidine synthase